MKKHISKCIECGREFELRVNHVGKINVCEREDCRRERLERLKREHPATIIIGDVEYECLEG
jgi:hypothetical protein